MFKAVMIGLCLLVLACANEERPAPPYTVIFDATATTPLVNVVYTAMDDWNQALGTDALQRGDSLAPEPCNHVRVTLVDNVLDGQHLLPPVGTTQRVGCNFVIRLSTEALSDVTTVEHELGHTLGLIDSDDPQSVMFWVITRWPTSITAENVADVRKRWGF